MDIAEHRTGFPLPPLSIPEPGRVDVWLMDLAGMPMMVGQEPSQVSEPSPLAHRQRDLRIRQQLFLRLLFGRYLDQPGKDIRIKKTPEGKPYLADRPFEISLSHTRQWLAVGVSAESVIGIDIEVDRVLGRASAMAKRCYGGKEALSIHALDEPACSRLFLERWVRTEAMVKAQGVSLAKSLSGIQFALPSLSLQATPVDWPEVNQWTVASMKWSAPLVGAIASLAEIKRMDLHHVVMGAS